MTMIHTSLLVVCEFVWMKTCYSVQILYHPPWVLHSSSSPFQFFTIPHFSAIFFSARHSSPIFLPPLPSLPLWNCAIYSPPPLSPTHFSRFFFPFKIYFLFLRINCTVLYSGINSWNTVTVNNLLSVWEKASAAPICRGLESSLPVVGHLVFTEKLFRRAWISLICFPERVGSTKRELVTYTVVSKQSIYS